MFSIRSVVATIVLQVAIVCLFSLPVSGHEGLHEQIIAVTKQIRKSPKDPALYLKRAELYRLHEEWKNAEADLVRAERLDRNLTAVDLGWGKLWLDAKQFSKAHTALEKYLLKQPNSFEGAITMARVLAKLKTDTSINYFTKAIVLAPHDSAEIYLERTEVLATAGRIDEALSGLDEGIKKLGTLVTLQNAAIELEVRRRRYDLALERLDILAVAMPRKETFLLRRGEILLQAGRPCEARSSLIESQSGFDALPVPRKNVRAVRGQMVRIQALLNSESVRKCPLAGGRPQIPQSLSSTSR